MQIRARMDGLIQLPIFLIRRVDWQATPYRIRFGGTASQSGAIGSSPFQGEEMIGRQLGLYVHQSVPQNSQQQR